MADKLSEEQVAELKQVSKLQSFVFVILTIILTIGISRLLMSLMSMVEEQSVQMSWAGP